MQFWEGVHLALVQIRSEKLKSFFSVLGVIVGVMFLIVVVSVVEGMDRYVREDFSSQLSGINTLTLRRWTDDGIEILVNRRNPFASGPEIDWRERLRRPEVTLDDYALLRDGLRELDVSVGAYADVGGTVVGDNGNVASGVSLRAVTPEMLEIRDWSIERGRGFSRQEDVEGSAVAILGQETAEVIFEGLDPIGRRVRIGGVPFRVIGVIEEQGTSFGQSFDNLLLAPIRSPIRARTGPSAVVEEVVVQVPAPEMIPDVRVRMEGLLREARRLRPSEEPNFAIDTADDVLSIWDTISRVLFTALPGLVSISLIVGGIVIMNIMLVSVMERTREIGVRKAVGARRRDILLQVMVESATLSGVGALGGVAIGVGLTMVVRAVSPLPTAVDPLWITVGVGLGVVVGIVAGVYPAVRASGMNPVDALRYE